MPVGSGTITLARKRLWGVPQPGMVLPPSDRNTALDVHAIANPVSGRKQLGPVLRAVGRLLARHGANLTCHVTQGPGQATRIATQVPDDARAVIAVGGDGTVREVVGGLIDRPVPFVVLPTGTENIVAKHFGMSAEPGALAHRVLHGVPMPLDVGVVDGRHFLIVAGIGFDADVVARLAAMREGHIGYLDYFWPLLRTFAGHQFPDIAVTVDGEPVFAGRGLALVGNLPRYSIGLRILDRASWDDGLLDVCVYRCRSRVRLLRHSVRTALRRHVEAGDVTYVQGRSVSVSSAGTVNYQLDGDLGGVLPVHFRVLPRAVRCLMAV